MSHELQQIFNVNSNAVGEIVDFDFISDENFLLLVALTNKGNLIALHRSNNQQNCQCVPLFDIYTEYCEPLLISVLPDASAVVLVLSNDAFLLIPIRCLMNVKWGDQNGINEPIQFQVELNVENCLKLPTSVISFKSSHNGRTYIAFSNKAGYINVVDVHLRRLIASLSTNETIHKLEVYRSPIGPDIWLVISHFTGQQSLLRLETAELPLRENLAHTITNEHITQLEDQLTTVNMDNALTVFSAEKRTLTLVKDITELKELSRFSTPQNTWISFYAPRLLLFVTNDFDIYSSFPFVENCTPKQVLQNGDIDSDIRILGFVPMSRSNIQELDACLIVTNGGIFGLFPKVQIASLTLNLLAESGFSKTPFIQICEFTQKDAWTLYETILRQVVNQQLPDHIDGMMLLAIEMAFDLKKLTALVNELGQHDSLIPYLTIRCDKDQSDPSTRQLLFETYMHKLWKLDSNSVEKSKLEDDIRNFLIKFDCSTQIIAVLLKHNLLSCVSIILQRHRSIVTPPIASYFTETNKWNNPDQLNLLRILCSLHWTILESPVKNVLYKRFLSFLSHLRHLYEYTMVANFASKEIRFDPLMATPLYLYSACALQPHLTSTIPKLCSIGLGSNFTIMIGDDRSLWTWGEFKAGNQRARNKSDETNRVTKRTTNDALRSILVANGQENAPLFKLAKLPTQIEIPKELDDDPIGFCQISCGTEHVLLLTSMGRVYTIGINRFGQCGIGHNYPVLRLTEIQCSFGPITSVHAGHYSSALIDKNGGVWMFGWSIHGQLASPSISNINIPTKVDQLGTILIKDVALGYAHSLFLTTTGDIYGCGQMENGELIADPQKLPQLCHGRSKTWRLLKLDLPEPIEMIASGYFQGLAVSANAIYQFGESPQTLKMAAFWQKRQNAKSRTERNDSPKLSTQLQPDEKSEALMSNWSEENYRMSRDHFKIRRVCDWNLSERPIKTISSGYNHSAILTEGELLTWGGSLYCQLGHGTKADKLVPTQMSGPIGVVWSNVKCGRNTTVAVSDRGEVFVWGRNERSQLGVPTTSNNNSSNGTPTNSAKASPMRCIFKSSTSNKKRTIEVPVSQCVDKPTLVSGIVCSVHYDAFFKADLQSSLLELINSCDQQILATTAQQFRIRPIFSLLALQVQLMAGDLLHAADVLSTMYSSNRQQIQREIHDLKATEPNHNNNVNAVHSQSDNGNSMPTSTSIKSKSSAANLLDAINGHADLKVGQLSLDEFEKAIDQLWSLIVAHPVEDVKTITVLIMLCKHLPIYGRVSMDSRLCRLIAGHVELPQKNMLSSSSTSTTRKSNSLNADPSSLSHSDYCTSSTLNRQRMNELKNPKERAAALRRARCPGVSKLQALRARVEPVADRFDFYSTCGHFERRVQETGVRKLQLTKQKCSFRKCSQCVPKIVSSPTITVRTHPS